MKNLVQELVEGAIVKHEGEDWVIKSRNKSVVELVNLEGDNKLTTVDKVALSAEFKPHGVATVYDMVKEFHKTFKHPVGDLTPLTMEQVGNRSDYTVEEIVEALYVTSKDDTEFDLAIDKFIKNVQKASAKVRKTERPSNNAELTVAQSDAFGDQVYLTIGSLVTLLGDALTAENLVYHIHNANMTKLFTVEEGNKYVKQDPVTNKILKSPDFIAPEPQLERILGLAKLSMQVRS